MKRLQILVISLMAAVFCLTTSNVSAQNSISTQISDLGRGAMEDYDFFEYDSAIQKLDEAVDLIEKNQIADESAAQIYISIGLVEYARFKDSAYNIAEKRTYEAFLKAASLSPDIKIPNDYKSSEIDAILSRAKADLATRPADPPAPPVVETPPAPPQLNHIPVSSAVPCIPLTIAAQVPPHPDAAHTTLHYRSNSETEYTTAEMLPDYGRNYDNSNIFAHISAKETYTDQLRYYIDVTNSSGEVVATSATPEAPYVITMFGSCENLPFAQEKPSIFEATLLIGMGAGYFNGNTDRYNMVDAYGKTKLTGNGLVPMWLHIRADFMFNLPKDFQFGPYIRYSLIDATSASVMLGVVARYYALNKDPYRLYLGLGLGWGEASTTVNWGALTVPPIEGVYPEGAYWANFRDPYRIGGLKSVHLMPQIGFAWMPSKHVGLAVDASFPIHFNNKVTVENGYKYNENRTDSGIGFHFDISVGPVFRF